MDASPLWRRAAGLGVTVAATLAVTATVTVPTTPVAYGTARHLSAQDSAWGGYVATGQQFTSISGSWVEPQVTCNTSNDLFAPWVGVDGYGSQSVEQTGVETNCSSGSPAYRPWYEMYPQDPVYWNDPVGPGDHMTGSVVDNGGGNYTITLTDDTRAWTEHTNQNYNGQDASAEAVIESPSQSYPSFTELDFSNITVNGQVFDASNPQPLTSGGYSPGPLSNGSFSMTPGGGGGGWPWQRHQHISAVPNATSVRY